MKSSHEGYYFYQDNDRKIEDAFLICSHCEQGMLRQAWKQRGGMCMVCDAPICTTCHGRTAKFGCEGPSVRKLERAVNELYRREQNAKILGI